VSQYTLRVSSSCDEVFQYFPGKVPLEVREEIIEIIDDGTLVATLLLGDSTRGELLIPLHDIGVQKDWLFVKPQDDTPGYIMTLELAHVDRIPNNWLETGLDILTGRPWYLKAEDIYNLTKHVLKEYNISNSRPVVELCRLVDFTTLAVAQNLLSVRVEEGSLLFLLFPLR
jgi:hypothetical protein